MYRYKLIIAYIGTDFHGWQMQPCGIPTVQGTIEEALSIIFGTRIPIIASSRTDTGVHAQGQVAHINIPEYLPTKMLFARLNTLLPQSISIRSIERTDASFHAQYTTYKHYCYSLWSANIAPLPQQKLYTWNTAPLNYKKMREATTHIIGTRDFIAFKNSATEDIPTIRTVYSIYMEHDPYYEKITHWHILGSGFLRQMIRNIMGLLVHVGQDKISVDRIPSFFTGSCRKNLPAPTAPATGLSLHSIGYATHAIYESSPL